MKTKAPEKRKEKQNITHITLNANNNNNTFNNTVHITSITTIIVKYFFNCFRRVIARHERVYNNNSVANDANVRR